MFRTHGQFEVTPVLHPLLPCFKVQQASLLYNPLSKGVLHFEHNLMHPQDTLTKVVMPGATSSKGLCGIWQVLWLLCSKDASGGLVI